MKMEFIKLIDKKRLGLPLSTEEIYWMINHLDTIPDYQLSAWLMAVCINGLDKNETRELTRAMAYSGHVLTLKRHSECDMGGQARKSRCRGFVDKHSTGGVGDKVSLVLSPLLASIGFKVSKFSGRSLGHTGGTIDKLEAIPGFRTDISMKQFEKQIDEIGIALAAQTLEFAPADKKLYNLRDKSGTVESIPLIASSVMSKKIAGGADIILLDVKMGSGAFMKNLKDAQKLTKQMIEIGKGLNLTTKALITNMEQPLGYAVGNGLELQEALDTLEGKNKNDFYQLVIELGSLIAGRKELEDSINSGKAYVKFAEFVEAQGGDISKIEAANKPKYKIEVQATEEGYVKKLDAYEVGKAIHELGYQLNINETLQGDSSSSAASDYNVDNSAGAVFKAKIGDYVRAGDILFTVQANNEGGLQKAKDKLLNAYLFSKSKVRKPKLVFKTFK